MKLSLRRKKTSPPPESSRRRAVQISEQGSRASFSYYSNRSVTPPGVSGREVSTSRNRTETASLSRSFWRGRRLLPWLGIVASMAIFGWLTFLSSSAVVLTVDTTGAITSEATAQYEETVQTLLGQSLLNRSKLTVNTSGIVRELRKHHPEIEYATLVVPIFGSQPRVYVSLSEPAFILQSQTARYLLSASGYVTGLAEDSTVELPLVVDETGETVTVSKRLLPASHVAFMQKVDYQLTQKEFVIDRFILPKNSAYEVNVRLKGKPFAIRFNLAEDATVQSGAAVAVLEQLGEASPSTYLDVRVPGRAFYR